MGKPIATTLRMSPFGSLVIFHSKSMKYFLFSLLFIASISSATTSLELTIADTLANYDIIVDQKTPAGYRLNDTITRAEATGVALNVADVELPEKYFCRNYFRDVQYDRVNNWVCRAIEIASDYDIISRMNDLAKPKTPISRIEALAIIMRAGKVSYAKNVDRSSYPATMPQWEVDILEGALQYHIISSTNNFGPDMMATRIDVFGMIYNMRFAGTKMEYITDTKVPENLTSAPEEGQGITITLPGTTPTPTPTTTNNAPLTAFYITVASKEVKVNVPFDITVRAIDKNGNTLTSYTGTLYFDLLTGAYANISLPMTDEGYAFIASDKGVMTFKGVTIKTPGKYSLDVYEIESGADVSSMIELNATEGSTVTTQNTNQVADFVVAVPQTVTKNTPFTMTVSAMNSAGKVITNYTGTIYFDTNNIAADVVFPNTKKSYTFTAADK